MADILNTPYLGPHPLSTTSITLADSASADAFGRLRVSESATLFDSKQLNDALPLEWDDAETSGSGTGSSHSINEAATTMTVGAATAGTRVRQTFRRFNYEPGKSSLMLFTGVMGAAATGITRRIGLFDDNNGLFFEQTSASLHVVCRSNVTGSPVNTTAAQASWNVDPMDGTGPSGKTLDITKAQIFAMDFEWLGVGRVRFGLVIDGIIYYVHEFLNANTTFAGVYMSTPNLPMRYEIVNDGTGDAAELQHICSTIMSEGGTQSKGITRWFSTEGTHIDANTADRLYPVVGIRLQATKLGTTVFPEAAAMLAETNDDFEWQLLLNPTVEGTFSYNTVANSSMQTALGTSANSISAPGTILAGGWISSNDNVAVPAQNAIALGAAIDGTRDTIVLCARPLTSNADIQGGLGVRELL